jgi:hypothetical protein
MCGASERRRFTGLSRRVSYRGALKPRPGRGRAHEITNLELLYHSEKSSSCFLSQLDVPSKTDSFDSVLVAKEVGWYRWSARTEWSDLVRSGFGMTGRPRRRGKEKVTACNVNHADQREKNLAGLAGHTELTRQTRPPSRRKESMTSQQPQAGAATAFSVSQRDRSAAADRQTFRK